MLSSGQVPEAISQEFVEAIRQDDSETVRRLLETHKSELTTAQFKIPPNETRFPAEVEHDAFTFLGAFVGPLTGLQFALLIGKDHIASDILDSTFEQDIDTTFGNGNTALHLAVLLGAQGMVSALMDRGADVSLKNKRGYSAVHMSDDPEILKLLETQEG
ncbi:hypothetical protein B0O80DRAFT_496067 [Mortierella sp. GBAus27b]|nr:hypothetical protein BGX31_011247 [Mortierella sp. GBA43]KAI8358309.1 hypothetical protein B0O80DRAFT_496067 [Mortierella sp. GBAus27b]